MGGWKKRWGDIRELNSQPKCQEINKLCVQKINQEKSTMSILLVMWRQIAEEITKVFQLVAWGQTVGWARGMQFFIINLLVVFDF